MQSHVMSVLLAITVPHLLRPLAVQDITAKLQQHPVAFVQVGLNVLEVEQVTPCVLQELILIMGAIPALPVSQGSTVP